MSLKYNFKVLKCNILFVSSDVKSIEDLGEQNNLFYNCEVEIKCINSWEWSGLIIYDSNILEFSNNLFNIQIIEPDQILFSPKSFVIEEFILYFQIIEDFEFLINIISKRHLTLQKITTETFYGKFAPKDIHININRLTLCKRFHRQQEAFNFYDSLPNQDKALSKLFTFESKQLGKRYFVVCDINSFYTQYFQTIPKHRHVYEIIRENFPCRLYLDVEFYQSSNPDVDGDSLLQTFINLVIWKLSELFSFHINYQDILIFDSSTSVKFSKHVHFVIKEKKLNVEYLFPNNSYISSFLNLILNDISYVFHTEQENFGPVLRYNGSLRYPKPEFKSLWLRPNNDSNDIANQNFQISSFFIDLNVYTKNRAFRLFGSCKYKKDAVLSILPKDKMNYCFSTDVHTQTDLFKLYLKNSFIIPSDLMNPEENLNCNNLSKLEFLLNSTGPKEKGNFMELLPIFNYSRYKIIDFRKIQIENSVKEKIQSISVYSKKSGQTPFPLLDSFVEKLASSRGNVQGIIYTWNVIYLPQDDFPIYKIRYLISKNRFCENINRMHKSNGIYFEANLMTKELSQSCFDIDCRGFKSSPVLIPDGILPSPDVIIQILSTLET